MTKEAPHYIGHKKRLKEKFLKSGLHALADYEALELVLSLAITRKDVKPLAKALLEKFGSFSAVLDADPLLLREIKGLGENAIAALKLVKESSTKYLREKSRESCIISSPEALVNYCKAAMAGLRDEEFRTIFLNSKNEVIADEALCRGTVDQTAVYPRKVAERAIHHNASSLIFVHNHPSGHPAPSRADRELTRMLKEALSSLQIRVHDHMIIGKSAHYSFAEEGIL
ncbi:MAG: DNA repair protein RadC [Deltaproteobacteria bacterium]|nr:DNA repair protein RadC [Deltaproteobacteria bacterium]